MKLSSIQEQHLLGAATSGTVDYHLVARADPPRLGMWGTFTGHVGQLEIGTTVVFDDGRLAVTLDLPRVGADELAPWLPGRPLTMPVSASARFGGVPPLFDLAGEVKLPAIQGAPPGALSMRGRLRVGDEPTADVNLAVDNLNVQLFGDDLVPTRLTARARVWGQLAGDDTELRAELRSAPSEIAGESVPPVAGVVAYARSGLAAYLQVDEAGVPVAAELGYRPGAGVWFALRAVAAELATVPRLSPLLQASIGGGQLRGRADVIVLGGLRDGEADVTTAATLVGASWPCAGRCAQAAVHGVQLTSRLRGALDDLQIEADAVGVGLRVGGQRFGSFRLTAKGPVRAPTVRVVALDAGQRQLEVLAVVEPTKGSARNVSLSLGRGSTVVHGRVARVAASGGALRLDGVSLEGAKGGKVEGSLQVVNQELVGKLAGTGIALEPLSRLLDLPYPLQGTASVDIDLSRDETGRHGHAKLAIHDGGMLVISGVNLELEAQFDGRRVQPTIDLKLQSEALSAAAAAGDPCAGTIAAIGFEQASGELDGALLSPAAWRQVTGSGTLTLRDVKLRCLAEVWDQFDPMRPIPFERIDGVVNGSVQIGRGADQRLPSLSDLDLRTAGLVLTPRARAVDQPPPWSTDRLDVALGGSFDGVTGETTVEARVLGWAAPVAGQSAGAPVELARVNGSTTVDIGALLTGGKQARDSLIDAPLSARLETGRLPIAQWTALPEPVRESVGDVAGDIDLSAYLEGTLRRPALALRARAYSLAPAAGTAAGARQWLVPVDLDVVANYYDGAGTLGGVVQHDSREIAAVGGTLKGNPSARLLGEGDDRWTGSLAADIKGLPLDSLPAFARAGVQGKLAGRVALENLRGDDPQLHVNLSVPDLRFGRGVAFDQATFRVRPVGDGEGGIVTVQSELDVRGGGGLRLAGYGSLTWRDGLVPGINSDAPAALLVSADRFPVRTAQPFLSESVSKLGGQLDGAVRVTYHELLGRDLAIDADMTLSNGVVHLPGMGQELYDVGARVSSTPNLIRIEDITASAGGGRGEGWLVVQHDDARVKIVTGVFTIREHEPIPIAVEGVPLGTASGKLVLSVQNRPEEIDVHLTAAGMRVRLPATASQQVQPLTDHRDVAISHPLRQPKEVEGKGRESAVSLTVTVVDAEMDGGSLRIRFGTGAKEPIRMTADGSLSGELNLSDGEINLLGKVFEIDRGLVRLRTEAPDNPYVNVTSHWNAPDGSIVYCDYVGLLRPIAREKIRFRSNPPRAQQEIVSLLILGEGGDAAPGSAGSGSGDRAGSLGRGIAAAQFNAMLGDVAPGVSTSVSSGEGSVSTAIIYQLNDSVTARASYERATVQGTVDEGEATATQGDDQTATRTSVSVDWRFAPSWLLRGSVGLGDQPSSGLDLLFQHRY
ncbi:MAG: translocation/assembly module TamB domain-containing protein [Deltaproteobacteria bacterium]|nr:translocation/assembly module TamB domain-containing protein [Deltaproteobacteria bacterium]